MLYCVAMTTSIGRLVTISFLLSIGASSGCAVEFDDDDYTTEAQEGDRSDVSQELNAQLVAFLPHILPGDIILTSNIGGVGCDFLSDIENSMTRLTYCHAMLVTAADNINGVTTLEAAGPGQDVAIFTNRQMKLVTVAKVVVLRVKGQNGAYLHSALTTGVLRSAIAALVGRPYKHPPLSEGDQGVYCSLIPWLAYLEAGIDLDLGWVPGGVTPDELYMSSFTVPVHQSRFDKAL